MQRVRRGVDAHVGGSHSLVQLFFGTGHHVVDHAAPAQFFYKVHMLVVCMFRVRNCSEPMPFSAVLLGLQMYKLKEAMPYKSMT